MNQELLILCITIFCARIMDVSLGTIRTMYTVKGRKYTAAAIGFFEVFLWFTVVREALSTDSKSLFVAFAYAAGYAIGTLIGIGLSEKFINGIVSLKITLSSEDDTIVEEIRNKGYAVTVMTGKGKEADKYILLMEIEKKNLEKTQKLIKKLDEKAYIVVSETKYTQNGYIK